MRKLVLLFTTSLLAGVVAVGQTCPPAMSMTSAADTECCCHQSQSHCGCQDGAVSAPCHTAAVADDAVVQTAPAPAVLASVPILPVWVPVREALALPFFSEAPLAPESGGPPGSRAPPRFL